MTLFELSPDEVRKMQCRRQIVGKPGKRRDRLIQMYLAAEAHELGWIVKRRSADPGAQVFHDRAFADAVTTFDNKEPRL